MDIEDMTHRKKEEGMMKKWIILLCCLSLFFMGGSLLHAQYNINVRIEAEDLYDGRVLCGGGVDWLRMGHGEGWANHPSDFIYAMCGNRHWLCDYRTVYHCQYQCADVYVSAEINIPETGDYIIYAYVASWADSAVIETNAGCNREDKWETGHWYVAWDDVSVLDKPNQDETLPKDNLWSIFPHNDYCMTFGLDSVILGLDRLDCPGGAGDPRHCDFPVEKFNLTAGKHTLYLKVADEYTLLDWIWVAKVGDPAPDAIPGRPWGDTAVEERPVHRPTGFVLEQNYPNPFNPETTILYYLPVRANVDLSVYDLTGKKVTSLVKATQSPGLQNVVFNATGLPSGTYFYKLLVTCTTCEGKKKTLSNRVKEMQYVK